jgi:site-specific DNA-methyltransferase (adenine-specific)
MDEQSGELKSGDMNGLYHGFGNHEIYGKGGKRDAISYGDKGGASRFFYCAKASKSERNQGLEGFEEKRPDNRTTRDMGVFDEKGVGKQSNFHPTVKPVKLMQYLVKLITPPNGKVLDPFCGSGTTGIACKLEGFEFVGLEQDTEYSKIAQSRIDNYQEEIEEIVYVTNKEGEKVQITQTSLF